MMRDDKVLLSDERRVYRELDPADRYTVIEYGDYEQRETRDEEVEGLRRVHRYFQIIVRVTEPCMDRTLHRLACPRNVYFTLVAIH